MKYRYNIRVLYYRITDPKRDTVKSETIRTNDYFDLFEKAERHNPNPEIYDFMMENLNK